MSNKKENVVRLTDRELDLIEKFRKQPELLSLLSLSIDTKVKEYVDSYNYLKSDSFNDIFASNYKENINSLLVVKQLLVEI